MKLKNRKVQKENKLLTIPCEVFSRVVGYYRPVKDWNEGKREEFEARKYLKVEDGDK